LFAQKRTNKTNAFVEKDVILFQKQMAVTVPTRVAESLGV